MAKDLTDSESGRRSFRPTLVNIILLGIVVVQSLLFSEKTLSATVEPPPRVLVTKETNTPVLYGHIHMAKTAGSTVNGELAVRYEKVCGHKGYSFDALRPPLQDNQQDSVARLYPKYNRGRVPTEVMMEIGFQDCDYVSLEESWKLWKKLFDDWPLPVELHVPCRDPIEHLMSQCNMRHLTFECNDDWKSNVDRCMIHMYRFSKQLVKTTNFGVKCFDAMDIPGYVRYMGGRLQARTIAGTYKFRPFNANRTKTTECIWQHSELQTQIRNYLIETYDYYDFCVNDCMGSENELPLPQPVNSVSVA